MVTLVFALLFAPVVDVAPPPRPVHDHAQMRAKAAFAFEAAKITRPVKVTEADKSAARRAFEDAALRLAASKAPKH